LGRPPRTPTGWVEFYIQTWSSATSIRYRLAGAEECISYGMPAFRLKGKLIAGLRAAASHCSYHPMSGATLATLRAELAQYDTSPGTIRFPARAPLPAGLIRKLVKARIAELAD
jgi:uncharacterized protein YdhG (YjbR/CyaY superfamily)